MKLGQGIKKQWRQVNEYIAINVIDNETETDNGELRVRKRRPLENLINCDHYSTDHPACRQS